MRRRIGPRRPTGKAQPESNDTGTVGNEAFVRALLVSLSLVACSGGRPVEAPLPVGPPGTLTVQLRASVGWPYRTERALLAVDGSVARFARALPVEAGAHTVAMQIDLSMPCSAFSSKRAIVRVRSRRLVGVGGAPVAAAASLSLRPDASLPWTERVQLRWMVAGETAFDARPPEPPACAKLDRAHRALCVVSARVEEAKKQRDVIKVVCQNDKLVRMQALLPLVDAGDASAVQRIEGLAIESEQCVGEELAFVDEADVSTLGDCGPELDFER